MVVAGRNSLKPVSKIRKAQNRFSRNARLLNTVLVQNWSTEFHENRTNWFVSETEWQTDWRWTDVVCT